VLGITEHNEGREAAFSELNAGLDHVSFTVASRAALEQWARHLDAAGVAHSGVVDDQFGSRINLRDPDNIQLELVVLRDTD
jgi:catechol-2,3-dioxygenase